MKKLFCYCKAVSKTTRLWPFYGLLSIKIRGSFIGQWSDSSSRGVVGHDRFLSLWKRLTQTLKRKTERSSSVIYLLADEMKNLELVKDGERWFWWNSSTCKASLIYFKIRSGVCGQQVFGITNERNPVDRLTDTQVFSKAIFVFVLFRISSSSAKHHGNNVPTLAGDN